MASNRLENVVLASTTQPNDQSVTIDIDTKSTEPAQPLIESDIFQNIKIYESIEEFNRNLPDTVTLLKTPDGNHVYLV